MRISSFVAFLPLVLVACASAEEPTDQGSGAQTASSCSASQLKQTYSTALTKLRGSYADAMTDYKQSVVDALASHGDASATAIDAHRAAVAAAEEELAYMLSEIPVLVGDEGAAAVANRAVANHLDQVGEDGPIGPDRKAAIDEATRAYYAAAEAARLAYVSATSEAAAAYTRDTDAAFRACQR